MLFGTEKNPFLTQGFLQRVGEELASRECGREIRDDERLLFHGGQRHGGG